MPTNSGERNPLLRPRQKNHWRWLVLLAFSFFSFSSALMWITFAPCVYIFAEYYFKSTSTGINAINSLSSVYMLVYPFAIQFTFKYFEDRAMGSPGNGLRRGILIGAVLNVIGSAVRWLGAVPSVYGFCVLFLGQTMAAIAQVFMLAIPPQLAVAWFPKNEINLATSIAVSANNLGVAAGCALTPLMVKQATQKKDVPTLLFFQFMMCLIVLGFIQYAFQRSPPYWRSMIKEVSSVDQQSLRLGKEKRFIYMLIAYSIIMGAQCAVITLLAQILIPPFKSNMNENSVGLLGAFMLFVGVPASILGGYYLDRTSQYSKVCTLLSAVTAISTLGLYISCEIRYVTGVILSCLCFGVASYAISPAFFQFASELFYPVNEIIPTGYLFTVGNMGGVFLVAVMGWSENLDIEFPMRLPMLCLTLAMFVSVYFMSQVKGVLKRSEALAL
ncbi:major facilitator superfamily domain-containing protein [Gilbertella persicaria]|uniref:major facilitator superfamily domain-containing protein n=1 Tax=Gilbertella persicaria TaxID=101096 RepID=UPI0022211E9B|nr:major facilitator superfamily domain-containing protein [Gilbertella persicaria]KAI8076624.1 major facilitator superfamily domain-containing protein [Gilbertella persicaria]